jgi:hypothetical protein
MASPTNLLQVRGDSEALIDLLKGPLDKALVGRRSFYDVRVEAVGRVGEVLVSITGSKGRLPLLFGKEELEPGYVSRVVQDAVDRFAL